MSPTIILGVLVMVALTILGIWYVNRRLKAVEAKVKVEYGLSADRVRDMNRLTADVNEVRSSVGMLAQEMGLRFERRSAAPQAAPSLTKPSQVTKAAQPAATQPAATPKQIPRATTDTPTAATPKTTMTHQTQTVKVAADPPEAQPQEPQPDTARPAQSQPETQAPEPQVEAPAQAPREEPKPEPKRSAVRAKGRGKAAAGKGKRAIVFDLFPEFIGPPLPTKEGNVPRVEEVNDTDTECEGGVCPVPQRK